MHQTPVPRSIFVSLVFAILQPVCSVYGGEVLEYTHHLRGGQLTILMPDLKANPKEPIVVGLSVGLEIQGCGFRAVEDVAARSQTGDYLNFTVRPVDEENKVRAEIIEIRMHDRFVHFDDPPVHFLCTPGTTFRGRWVRKTK